VQLPVTSWIPLIHSKEGDDVRLVNLPRVDVLAKPSACRRRSSVPLADL
jgi:hypothetical protein